MQIHAIQHIGTRPSQQDAFFIAQGVGEQGSHVIMCVCDGVGGTHGGAHAAATAARAFGRELVEFATRGTHSIAGFRQHFEQARRHTTIQLACDADDAPGLEHACTTITACVLIDNRLFAGNIGDSPLVIGDGNILVHAWTEHSKAALLRSAGVLTAEEYEDSPFRGILTRFAGTRSHTSSRPPCAEYRLGPEDRVVMCSDGALEAITLKRMREQLGAPSLSTIRALFDNAIRARATDNATLILCGRDDEEALRDMYADSIAESANQL